MPSVLDRSDFRSLEPDTGHERHTWWVLSTSAAIGFCLGAFVYPMWTDNVESAQVQAHLVDYAASDVMRVYHTSAYSIVIQIAAALLRTGLSEWTLSVFFSGLQAALSCSALSLFTLAVSRSATTALLVPVLLLRFRNGVADWPGVYLAVFHGHHYPNLFPNHTSLYGIIGLFWIILVFSLFSLRKVRTASVMLGLTPAIHIGLTPLCVVGALSAAAFLRNWLRPWRRTIVRYAAIGLSISAGTAIWHAAFHWDVPHDIPPAEIDRVASAFARVWDDHSTLLGSDSWNDFFESEYYTIFLALSFLTYLRRYLPESARVVLVAVASVTIVACAYTVFVNLRPDLVGWEVRALLITRWLNLSSFAFPVLALGLLGQLAFRQRDAIAVAALALVTGAVLAGYPVSITGAASVALSGGHEIDRVRAYFFPIAIVLSSCLLGFLRERQLDVSYPQKFGAPVAALAAIACVVSVQVHHVRHVNANRLRGRDAFTGALHALGSGTGMVAVGDDLWTAGRIQLRTRRPLLLDPTQMNLILKIPEVGPRIELIAKRLYDINDFSDISDFETGPPRLDRHWPQQPPEYWREIKREFGVTDVLVRNDVVLQLPKLYGDDYLAVYTIPSVQSSRMIVSP